ncbi:MAG TPA: DUF87 domain-containing protein [Acidimicrobiales bacterium]|nr:DUF87 domain-containing protein [Acidimicrobiales bacterium]
MNRIVTTALPGELPLEPVAVDDCDSILHCIDTDAYKPGHFAEIRRSIDRLDPTVEAGSFDDPVLFGWTWSAQALLGSLGLLRNQPSRTALISHLEPANLPGQVAQWLQDEIRRLAVDLHEGEENPLALGVLRGYRRWLRLLPRGCLAMRLAVASDAPLTPGLAESLSTDLTRSFEAGSEPFGVANIIWPTSAYELDACAALVDELRAVAWRVPAGPLGELLHLFDPLEAHTCFRVPVTPRGGLDGIASQRLSTLGRGADVRDLDRAITIGSLPAAGRFALSAHDLNQHVLVAGLPGFGKTSTVQLLLRRMYMDLGVPFLVIDPTKTDYEPLIDDLAAGGADALIVRLSRDAVGFNPLAVPSGVSPAVHAGRVIAAFDAAFELTTWFPLAHVLLSRAVYRLYDDLAVSGEQPTLRDLYRTVGDLIRHSQFGAELRGNLEGSLLGRLEFLATGPAGRALAGGSEAAIEWSSICDRPSLIELGAFAGPAERSLVFALIIASFVSWREAHLVTGLAHVTVLEEAHRLLRATRGTQAGVETFVDAIAELRGAGEGFIVVDQAPSMLHPGVLKLTGTKIAHRLVDADERAAVGSSMVLEAQQFDDVARLAPRRAVAYAASSAAAVLVDIDDAEVKPSAAAGIATRGGALSSTPVEEPLFCVGCPVMCVGPADPAATSAPDVVMALERRPADLIVAAHQQTGDAASAYCTAATALGRHHTSQPTALRKAIEALSRRYQEACAKAGARK